ncbi:hypothetical protein NL676_007496 [Syzygium grande]|nr:hypothetical protein NL676_007496 [Syzygium grande]
MFELQARGLGPIPNLLGCFCFGIFFCSTDENSRTVGFEAALGTSTGVRFRRPRCGTGARRLWPWPSNLRLTSRGRASPKSGEAMADLAHDGKGLSSPAAGGAELAVMAVRPRVSWPQKLHGHGART